MARKIVVVCDRCEEPAALKRYRVGTPTRSTSSTCEGTARLHWST